MEQTHLAAVLMGGLSFQGARTQTVVPGKIPPPSTHTPSSVPVPVGVILGKVPAICGFFNSGPPALWVCGGAAHQKQCTSGVGMVHLSGESLVLGNEVGWRGGGGVLILIS